MNSKTYVFFGNVGAGKGTQILFLKEFLEKRDKKNVVYVSPGVEFRKITSKESFSSGLVKEILSTGSLLPVFLVSHVITNVLLEEIKSANDHIIFDGFPRSVPQVDVFESAMEFFLKKDIEIIHIEISKNEAIKRLNNRGRHDDTEAGIKKRFEEYEKNVVPALKYLKEKGYKIHAVNGEMSVEDVRMDIFKSLSL